MKRRWLQWPQRALAEVNATSGVFALAGGGVLTTGLVLAAPVVLGLGGALFAGTTLWCAYRGFPPELVNPESLLGQKLTDLTQLDAAYPPLARVGFVGATCAGKSTLLAHLQAIKTPPGRTDFVHATVIGLPGAGGSHFAMIDAAGDRFAQQFKVADAADEIILFLDHTEDDSSKDIDSPRLHAHEEFVRQLTAHLRQSRRSPKKIHLLLNKRDLWESGPDAVRIRTWFNRQVSNWRQFATSVEITSAEHSNRITDDLTNLVQVLRRWAERK